MNSIFIYRDEQEYGPYSIQEVRDFLISEKVSLDDHARTQSASEWTTVRTLLGNSPALPPPLASKVESRSEVKINQKAATYGTVTLILGLISLVACLILLFVDCYGFPFVLFLLFLSVPSIDRGHRNLASSGSVKTVAILNLILGYAVTMTVLIMGWNGEATAKIEYPGDMRDIEGSLRKMVGLGSDESTPVKLQTRYIQGRIRQVINGSKADQGYLISIVEAGQIDESGEVVFIVGDPRVYADGDSYLANTYYAGIQQYETVLHAIKTVRRYTPNKDLAMELLAQ